MVISVNSTSQNWVDSTSLYLNRLCKYTSTTAGSSRFLSLLRNFARLSNELSRVPSQFATQLEKVAGQGVSGLGLVRLPAMTQNAYTAVSGLQDDKVALSRRVVKAFRETMEAFSCWGNVAALITSNLVFKRFVPLALFVSDSADLCLSMRDYQIANTRENLADLRDKEMYTYTKNYNILRIAKAATSLATAFITALVAFIGFALFPLAAIITMSIATTCIAIHRDLYKEQNSSNLIAFNE